MTNSKGDSVKRQKSSIMRWVKDNGYNVKGEYWDIESGKTDTMERTEFMKMIFDSETMGIKVLVFSDHTTINKHLGWSSSFYEWSINLGYSNTNPFKGLKLKRTVRPRDERDRFSELELKKIFGKENYIHFTNIEKGRYELYWTPLIGVFTGLRLGEITSLYLDNIKR
jgi:integrase